MTITQMQPLRVSFHLTELVLPPLQKALANKTNVKVRVYASGTDKQLDEGTLNFVDSAVDTTTGTIGLAATVGNSKLTLWPGQRVTVELEYGNVIGALTVPTVAVQQGQIGSYVWVIDDQNKALATPVKVTRFEGDLALIGSGLSDAAKVVVEGQAKLFNGVDVKTDAAASSTKPADTAATAANTTGKTN